MNAKLNALLANVTVEYHKLQNQHWYVSGPDFFQAHAQLESLYDELLPAIDDVAELILTLGGRPIASLAEVLQQATIAERADEPLSSADAFANVRSDYQALLDQVTAIKEAADAESNHLVSAKMDEYVASLSKTLWMLRQQAA